MQVSLEMIFNQIPIEKYKPFNNQCSHHIETSQLICSANQLTGFYMIGTLVVKGLRESDNKIVINRNSRNNRAISTC